MRPPPEKYFPVSWTLLSLSTLALNEPKVGTDALFFLVPQPQSHGCTVDSARGCPPQAKLDSGLGSSKAAGLDGVGGAGGGREVRCRGSRGKRKEERRNY